MKTRRILMGALALAMVAATVIACSKEKETKVAQQTTENNERKPIATFDKATGQMTYHVGVEHLQAAMDKYTTSKRVGDVIVESWSITDNGSTENPIMMLSVLEVDTESSSKIAMYNTFVEADSHGNATEYYLTDLIRSGNYNYITSDAQDTYLVTVENNEVVSVELYNAKAPWTGGVTITCDREISCHNPGGCSPPDDPNGDCSECRYGKCHQIKTKTYLSQALSAF